MPEIDINYHRFISDCMINSKITSIIAKVSPEISEKQLDKFHSYLQSGFREIDILFSLPSIVMDSKIEIKGKKIVCFYPLLAKAILEDPSNKYHKLFVTYRDRLLVTNRAVDAVLYLYKIESSVTKGTYYIYRNIERVSHNDFIVLGKEEDPEEDDRITSAINKIIELKEG